MNNGIEDRKIVRLGDIVDIIDGLTYTPGNVTNDTTKIKVLRSSNVKNNTFTYDDMVYVDNIKVEENKFTKKGDILMCVRNGSTNLIGKNCLINDNIDNATHGAFMSVLRSDEPEYVFQLLQTEQAKREIQKDLGATINQITKGNLLKFKFSIHKDKLKRDKIGNLLSAMDKLIEYTADQANNVRIKKEYLTRVLITDNKNVDISINYMKDILFIPDKVEMKNFDSKKILRLGLHVKGVTTVSENNTLMSKGTKYYIRSAGDFIYGKQNIFNGSVGIIPKKYDQYASSGDVPCLSFYDKEESSFFLQYVSRKNFYNSLETYANGSGSKRIHEKDLLNIKIKYPQQRKKISNILSAIDQLEDLYDLYSKELSLAKNYNLNKIFG